MKFKKALLYGAFTTVASAAVASAVYIANKMLNGVVKDTLANDTLVQEPKNIYVKKEEEPTAPLPVIKFEEQPEVQGFGQAAAQPQEQPAEEPMNVEPQIVTSEPEMPEILPEKEEPEEPAYNPYLEIKPPYEVAPVLPEDYLDEEGNKSEPVFKAPEVETPAEPAPLTFNDLNEMKQYKTPVAEEPELMVTPGLPYIAGKLVEDEEPRKEMAAQTETIEEPSFSTITSEPVISEPEPQVEMNTPLPQADDNIPKITVEFGSAEPQAEQPAAPAEQADDKAAKTQVIGSNTVSDEESNDAIQAVVKTYPGVNSKTLVSIMGEDNTGLVFEFSTSELRDETTLVEVYSITPDGNAILPPAEQKDEILKFGKSFITDKEDLRVFLQR